MLSNVQQVRTMRKVVLLAVVLMGALALGTFQAQAAGCGYSSGNGIWTVQVTPGYWYTIQVTNGSSWGSVSLAIYDYCWRDNFGNLVCGGFMGGSGPWGYSASVNFYASDSTYYARVSTNGNPYQICVY